MSNDVILHTPRMILRPFTVQDTCDVYAYARDPRVGPIAGWPAHQSYFESWDIVRTVFSQSGVFAMELRENHKVIGSIGFVGGHPAGELPDCPDDEIGYALRAAFWGRGRPLRGKLAVQADHGKVRVPLSVRPDHGGGPDAGVPADLLLLTDGGGLA